MRKRKEISLLGAVIFCTAAYLAIKLLKIEEEANKKASKMNIGTIPGL